MSLDEIDASFRSQGRERSLAADAPVWVDEIDTVWLVTAGCVELFAVEAAGRANRGPRRHVATITPGELLLGLAPQPGDRPADESGDRVGDRVGDPVGFLAVGHHRTTVVELGLDRFRALLDGAPGAPGSGDLVERCERWVARLTAALDTGATPRVFTPIAAAVDAAAVDAAAAAPAASEHALAAGEDARAGEAVVWVEPVVGTLALLGRDRLRLATGECLPLAREGWVTAIEAARVRGIGSAEALCSERGWRALRRLHRFAALELARLAEQGRLQDRERLAGRRSVDARALRSAFGRLAAVMAEGDAVDGASARGTPLVEAMRAVASSQGIEFSAPPSDGVVGGRDPIQQIASSNRIRTRRVVLAGDWWRRDHGSFLGFLRAEVAADKRPVALIQSSPGRYQLVEPTSGRRQAVTTAVAAGLEPTAVVLYRPLPARALAARDLIELGLVGCGRDLVMTVAMGLAAGALGMVVPIVMAQLFGEVIPSSARPELVKLTLALVATAVGIALFDLTRAFALLRVEGKTSASLQPSMFDRLLGLDAPFFRRFSVGDLTMRVLGIETIRRQVTGHAVTSILSSLFSVFSCALLFYYSWRAALVAVAVVGVLIAVTMVANHFQLRHQREVAELEGKTQGLVVQLLNAIAKIRVASAERRAFAEWAKRFSAQRELGFRAARIGSALGSFQGAYQVLGVAAVYLAVVGLGAGDQMTTAAFLAFNAAFGQFLVASLSLAGVVNGLLAVVPVYERTRPILEAIPEVGSDRRDPGELTGSLEFSHVSFRYQEDGPQILDDVSIRVLPGQFIALVGPSGSGKSTCLRLMLGFEAPASGSIYYDGQDLSTLDVSAVRRQSGVVLQNGQLMSGSILSNIIGSSLLTHDDAWEAARMAGLDRDIKQMPMGMHTVVSEGGATFSGGQKQRLLIARSIVTRPKLLLLDEATSALDNRTQAIVAASLERLQATRIVVAHRLSTIQTADQIYVFDRGRVVEHGTYDELLATGGLLAALVERQIA